MFVLTKEGKGRRAKATRVMKVEESSPLKACYALLALSAARVMFCSGDYAPGCSHAINIHIGFGDGMPLDVLTVCPITKRSNISHRTDK
eukprot:scaffold231200_cov16-Prasinocladus_malaysianus.AAC.2